jgi:hypothetical protein
MRIVIDPAVTTEDAERVAWNLNWDARTFVKKQQDVPYESIYETREGVEVHFVIDHVIGERYFVLEEIRKAGAVAAKIRKEVKTISADDVPSWAESTSAEKVKHGIAFAALLAPEKFDKRFFAWFERGFSHRNPEVREQTIVASGYVGWKQLREKLQEVAENDSDEEIRKSAKLMVEGFELQDRGELEN